jgi:hypothetical protein
MNFNYGPNAKKMFPWAEILLDNILKRAEITGVLVTSTNRTPRDQARIMYENLDGPLQDKHQYIDRQLKLYGPTGDIIVHVFEHQMSMGASRDDTIRAMEDAIINLGPEKVSVHCVNRQNKQVLDVAPSTVPEDKRNVFKAVVSGMALVTKFIPYPLDPAYHIEMTNRGNV